MLTLLGIVTLITLIGMVIESILQSNQQEKAWEDYDHCDCFLCKTELQRREQVSKFQSRIM